MIYKMRCLRGKDHFLPQQLPPSTQPYFFSQFRPPQLFSFFFLNDPAPPEIYPLPLRDALPISVRHVLRQPRQSEPAAFARWLTEVAAEGAYALIVPSTEVSLRGFLSIAPSHPLRLAAVLPSNEDRKSTRLNSSHLVISYAVFCL